MSSSLFQILLVVLLIGVNAFFSAAEVALIAVRQSRLRQMAEEGQLGAQVALDLLANPERLLSVVQVGVTLASLALGWAGEDTLHRILTGLLHPVTTPVTEKVMHGISFAISFLIISYLHVVAGEVLPKNLAMAKADRLAVLLAPSLLLFDRISLPFVIVVERSASAMMRAMKLKGAPHGGGHSAEELKLIVSSSRGLGYLPEAQEDIIHRVLDLGNLLVRTIMVPRQRIISIPSDASLDQVLKIINKERHSRFPVFDNGEKFLGILHYKDLLPVWEERRRAIRAGRAGRTFRIERLVRHAMVVPETKPVSQLLEEFRKGHAHMALVVDEFGTIAGLVTVEDVLEQLVGRIEDEHDEKTEPREAEVDHVELDGATRIRDLEADYGIELPADAGFETLAGFLLFRFGEIPETGAALEHERRRFTVLEMDRNRIARVRIEKLPQPVPAKEAETVPVQ